MITGVTVIGDLLRPDGSGQPGGVDRPVAWLFHAIRRQVALACNLPVSAMTTATVSGFAGTLAAERSIDRAAAWWASCYDRLLDPTLFDRHVMPRLAGQFCIGYEMPPHLCRALGAAGVPFVDLRIHPVRFLDDLIFAARASCPQTQSALAEIAVAEAEIIATAGLREAMCRMITQSGLPEDTLLVVGQRPLDSTQIVDGTFFDAGLHADTVARLCAAHRAVLLKPHPQERMHSLLVTAAGLAQNIAGVTEDNVYRLLALPQVTAVLTVNSSLAHEVPYFGQRLHTLAPLPVRLAWAGQDPGPDRHVSIDDRVLTPDFWRLVLAPHAAVSRTDGMRLTPKPNRLRLALDSFWNFNQIDTDRLPRAG